MFAYRKCFVLKKPYPNEVRPIAEKAAAIVVAILGRYNSFISGIHLGKREVVTYHTDDFHPKGILIGSVETPVTKMLGRKGEYHTYELVADPSQSIVVVSERVEPEQFVFQIGVKGVDPFILSFGTVEPKYRQPHDDNKPKVDACSESGSGVFNRSGELLGMTIGKIAPDVMLATPISELLELNRAN